MRAAESSEQTLHRQQQNKEHMASVRAAKKANDVSIEQAIVSFHSMVCVSVCLSVTQHFTSPMFVRLTNDTTYTKVRKFVRFTGKCSVAKLERFRHCTANA